MNFFKKYIEYFNHTFNIFTLYREGGNENYLKLINLFFFWYFKFFLVFSILARKNFEFAGYILFYSFLLMILNYFAKKFLVKYYLTYLCLSIFLFFHLLGGLIKIDEIRLYDYYVFGFIRYDWVIHFLGGFLCSFISFDLLKNYIEKKKRKKIILFIFIVITASAFGVFNEQLEFLAVIFLNAGKAVGDYNNNLNDIMNNFYGSVIAAYLILYTKIFKLRI